MASRRFYSHNAFWIVLKPTVKFCNHGEIELNDEALLDARAKGIDVFFGLETEIAGNLLVES